MGIDLRDVDQPIGTLSGGERQCVAIARAVYFGAKVLILDEPTAALGVKQSGVVLKYIVQARERGLGVIFITHNPHHAYPVGDRFLLLNRGTQHRLLREGADHPGGTHRADGRWRRARAAQPRARGHGRCRRRGRATKSARRHMSLGSLPAARDPDGDDRCTRSGWAPAPTPGACGSPTTRCRRRGSGSWTRSPRWATSGWSSGRTATCPPTRLGSPTSWAGAGSRWPAAPCTGTAACTGPATGRTSCAPPARWPS